MPRTIRIYSFIDADRSGKVRWVAHELGYQVEEERIQPGQHMGEAYRALNPFSMVPTAMVDGQTLFESTAICLHLAGREDALGLARVGDPSFWQWVHLYSSTLEMPAVNHFLAQRGVLDEAWEPLCAGFLKPRIGAAIEALPSDGYLCGAFSVADVCAGYVLRLCIQGGLASHDGRLRDYFERLRARPAAQAARIFDSLEV